MLYHLIISSIMKNSIDFQTGLLENYLEKTVRKASDMRGFFQDEKELEEMISQGDPTIYEVYAVPNNGEGEISYAVTVIHPGKVGKEFFMTKGHYHKIRNRGELYIGIRGKGLILMQKWAEMKIENIERGNIVYVPPCWAHRSVNVGSEDLVFLAIYPGDAGHDYGSIAEKGFAKIVVEEDGGYKIIDNPKYHE